jgi:hypothetical protein
VPEIENRRLGSWKEIAAYLDRDVSTVIRWEKDRGLPVHRIPGGKRHAVFAYTHEIDQWVSGSPLAAVPPAAPRARWLRAAALFGGVVALLVVAAAGYQWIRGASEPMVSVEFSTNRLEARDKAGRVLWSYPLPEPAEEPAGRAAGIRWIGDLAGDGHQEALVSVPLPGSSWGHENERELYCLSARGLPLWHFALRDTLTFGSGDYGPPWPICAWLMYGPPWQKRIALAVHHHTWWPSVVIVLDARGRELGRYVNSGYILTLSAMETPARTLLLAGGLSNASGPAGALAVLDGNRPAGSSPEEPGREFECKSCAPGRPLHYFIFPRSELNEVTLSHLNPVMEILPRDSGIEVSTQETSTESAGVHGIFEFTRDFQLVRARYSDSYWEVHQELEREGKIRHSKKHCPDRFGPRVVRAWDPTRGWFDIPNPAERK